MPDFNLGRAIAPQRKMRRDTDLHQFAVNDMETLKRESAVWVRRTSKWKLDECVAAGNPVQYALEVDGVTSPAGKVRRGGAFKAGSIENARWSVRVSFVGVGLAEIANKVKPALLSLIAQTFPHSRTGVLAASWVWWIQLDAIGKKDVASRVLGQTVPAQTGIYDVLWLAPGAGKEGAPASYAYFANQASMKKHERTAWNARQKRSRKYGWGVLRRVRGFMSETTRRLRGSKAQQQAGPLTVQAKFVRKHLTGTSSIANVKGGAPVIRVAFRSSLGRTLGL